MSTSRSAIYRQLSEFFRIGWSRFAWLARSGKNLFANALSKRGHAFDLVYDLKWIILVACFASVVFYLPAQITELYRIIFGDGNVVGITILFVSLALISAIAWLSCGIVAHARPTDTPPTTGRLDHERCIASFLCSLPFVACGAGLFAARVNQLPEKLKLQLSALGSPWENTARELTEALGRSLPRAGLFCFALAMSFFTLSYLAYPTGQRLFRRANLGVPTFFAILLLTIAVSAVAIVNPNFLPRSIGVFGCIAIFFLLLFAWSTQLSVWSIQYRFPLIPSLLAFAVLISYLGWTDNHTIRLLPSAPNSVPAPLASDQFRKWYQSRPDLRAYNEEYPVYIVTAEGGGIYAALQTAFFLARMQDTCPSFRDHLFAISSVSGGSLGAATFAATLRAKETASSGEKPESTSPEKGQGVSPEADDNAIEMIDASIGEREDVQIGLAPKLSRGGGGPCAQVRLNGAFPSSNEIGDYEKRVTDVLIQDHLSPLIAATLFPDFAQRFIPKAMPMLDRARALEYSFESAFAEKSGFSTDPFRESFLSLWNPESSSPALLINATDVGSGRRFLISPFVLDAVPLSEVSAGSVLYFPFWPARENLKKEQAEGQGYGGYGTGDLRLSTAAVISARFPWVTPAASFTIRNRDGTSHTLKLVDGGYVDNSGVETALDLVDSLQSTLKDLAKAAANGESIPGRDTPYRRARIVLIVLTGGTYPERTSYGIGETLDPIRALLSTRQTRGYVAIDRAMRQMEQRKFEGLPPTPVNELTLSDVRPVKLSNQYYDLPLGWSISKRTASIIAKQSGRYWDCEMTREFMQGNPTLSNADCVQMLVYHDLNESIDKARLEAAILNFKLPTAWLESERGIRLDHWGVLSCYREKTHQTLSLIQFQTLQTILDLWDKRNDLVDHRWLAYMLGLLERETAGLKIYEEVINKERAEARYGYQAPIGRALGNINPGDGWLYRGRGFMQITGRENYDRYEKALGYPLVNYPDLALNPAVSAEIAFRYVFPEAGQSLLAKYLNANSQEWFEANMAITHAPIRNGSPQAFHAHQIEIQAKKFYECITKNGEDRTGQTPGMNLN